MTENRNHRRKKRPAYDQAKDAQRRRSANGVRSQNSSHPITNPNFDPDAPRPSRYTERSVDYGSGYPDNSIQFPTGGRPAQNQNRNQNRDPNRHPQNGRNQNGRAGQRPRSSRNAVRTGQSRPQSRNPQPGRNAQRLRPTEANLRDPARREGKKKRKLTRKVLRRRRIIRRLTALAMLLCVIAAGIYLTVTMLFKISAIQVRTADGVVSEAGGYSSEQIVQALGVNRPYERVWRDLFEGRIDVPLMVEKGNAILSYIRHRDYRLSRNMAFEGTYNGLRFIAANMAQAGSDFFESLDNIANYDFMVSFSLNKRSKWNLSFRTVKDNVDVSAIAAAFGGGGHKKASGASGLDKLPEFLTQNVREWTKFNKGKRRNRPADGCGLFGRPAAVPSDGRRMYRAKKTDSGARQANRTSAWTVVKKWWWVR